MGDFTAVASRDPLRLQPPLAPRHRRRGTYRPATGLPEAVDVAMLLGVPLLLTGDPGIGKTRAAYWLADELGAGDPLRFDVKSETRGVDLLYSFDEVARFRDGAMGIHRPLVRYLWFGALGEAILRAAGGEAVLQTLYGEPLEGQALVRQAEAMRQSFGADWAPRDGGVTAADLKPDDKAFRSAAPAHRVVLIDELDKAPRDTPNDLLGEIEEMAFRIPELGVTVAAGSRYRPIVIVTSNSEKSLPAPFLRRCAYFDIPFPAKDADLREIVDAALDDLDGGDRLVTDAIAIVRLLRAPGSGIDKRPGTAELLAWLEMLVKRLDLAPRSSLRGQSREPQSLLLGSLLKTSADVERGKLLIGEWGRG